MSIEGGLGGGSIGGIGAAVEASLSNSFGPVMRFADIRLSINEGPVGADFRLENTMPLTIGSISEINFNNSPVGNEFEVSLSAKDAVFEAENIISQAQNPLTAGSAIVEAEAIIAQARPNPIEAVYWFTDIEPKVVKTAEVIMPQAEPAVVPSAVPNGWEYPAPQIEISPALDIQPILQEQEIEEEVLEKVAVENPKEELEEEEELETRKFVEDKEVSGQRKYEIKEAIIKAKAEASKLGLKKIAGWLVAKFLPAEHVGNRSQIIKKNGLDGSYQETLEAIAGAGELESEEKAVKRFNGIVAEKKPVKLGKEGAIVGQQDVARVFKYRIIKPSAPQEVVVKRILKKKVPQPLVQVVDTKVETTLEDYPDLVEVFQKAA